jgi:hypothetical protein
VPVGNEIGADGAKALAAALKDNTTLTSLSLNLSGEQSWFCDLCFLVSFVEVRGTNAPLVRLLWSTTINTSMYGVRVL